MLNISIADCEWLPVIPVIFLVDLITSSLSINSETNSSHDGKAQSPLPQRLREHLRSIHPKLNYRVVRKMRPSSLRHVSRWIGPRIAFPRAISTNGLESSSSFHRYTQHKQPKSDPKFHDCRYPIRSFTSRQQPENRDDPTQFSTHTAKLGLNSLLNGLNTTASGLNRIYTRLAQTKYGRLMRLDRPVGTNLLFLPGAWGIAIGATSVTDLIALSALFYGGAVLMRGAGCTINDIWDVDIDREVVRTKTRPIANGEISTPSAFMFLGAQLLGGLGVLSQLNTECFLLGSAVVLPVLFYPLAKRKTAYPQVVLGLTMNWTALMGYCAATGTVATPAVMLYGAGWCWTMVYDTIYAHQDREDDVRLGVGSTAVQFAGNTKPALAGLVAGKVGLLTAAGLAGGLSLPYFLGVGAAGMHLGQQVYSADLENAENCQTAFVSNVTTGTIVWLSILAGRLF